MFGSLIANLSATDYTGFVRSLGRYLADDQTTQTNRARLADANGSTSLASIDRGLRKAAGDPQLQQVVNEWWAGVQQALQLGAYGENWRTIPAAGDTPRSLSSVAMTLPGFIRRNVYDEGVRARMLEQAELIVRAELAGDTAKRMECANNLKQIAIGAHGSAMPHAEAYYVVTMADVLITSY
jgi:hypothetical protein